MMSRFSRVIESVSWAQGVPVMVAEEAQSVIDVVFQIASRQGFDPHKFLRDLCVLEGTPLFLAQNSGVLYCLVNALNLAKWRTGMGNIHALDVYVLPCWWKIALLSGQNETDGAMVYWRQM
jgi:hypothetical protein